MPAIRSLSAGLAGLLVAAAIAAPGSAQVEKNAGPLGVGRGAPRAARPLRPAAAPPEKAPRSGKAPVGAKTVGRAAREAAPAALEHASAHRRPAIGAVSAPAHKEGATARAGTGGGDIFEAEPNDTTAQTVPDIPVNVTGEISVAGDVDCYAVSVVQGTPIRVEVVADRVFGTLLDSYVVVLRSDGTTEIASNDDGYDDSVDSFLTFDAPYTGTVFVCVTDAQNLGGDGYGYVLNVSPAEPPDVGEVEPNGSAVNADAVVVPGIVFGALAPNEYDVFAFTGVAGETLVVDVDAEIFLSDADVAVTLFDDNFTEIVNDQAEGFLFFSDDDRDSRDPRFNLVLPYTGVYYLVVYDLLGLGGSTYFYSVNISTQSGVGAPRVTTIKTDATGNLMKKVIGSGFDRFGARAEINSDRIGWSRPANRKPTSQIQVKPPVSVVSGDVITVVNPDGRRSNPGIVR